MTGATTPATDIIQIEHALSNPAGAVSFSGHRPDKLPDNGDITKSAMGAVYGRLLEEIETAIHAGKTTFLHGMMAGFDLIAAQAVLELKAIYPQIRLLSVLPFHDGFFRTKHWYGKWPDLAMDILARSDQTVCLETNYFKGVYYRRNDWLVEHSSLVICYCTTCSSGTAYTSQKALKKGRPVININER